MKRSGILFVISSPSGVGKTTIANFLVEHDCNIMRSISHTTRKKRGEEKHCVDYFFTTEDEFLALCKKGQMLEYAKVFTNYYGTSLEYVNNHLSAGIDVLCCIDWQGAVQIKQKMQNSVFIFLLPPSFAELERRLHFRSTDSVEVIKNRLKVAKEEIKQYEIYDYVFINDDLHHTQSTILSLINAERQKLVHNKNFIRNHIKKLGVNYHI